ncbi:MAG: 13E12 repeat family protein [Microlunatus sp.]|nr:13E12 repeat family protein [Microlunatus sp.]
MSPGTAREHVRVARALRRMPTTTAAFRQGRLSYSKVRELTRVVGLVEEAEVCELALTATASQLARMVAGYRRASGTRIAQQPFRALTWPSATTR